jgi:thiol:disulfide interchange protein
MKISRTLAVIFTLLILGVAAAAQDPVKLSLKVPSRVVKAGDKFTAELNVKISTGWHIYSMTQPRGGPFATRITLESDQIFTSDGPVSGPKPQTTFDPTFEINTETHEGNIQFIVPILVSREAVSETRDLIINVRYQVCNETSCMPPKTIKVSSPVEVGAAEKSEGSPAVMVSSPRADIRAAENKTGPSASPTPKATPAAPNSEDQRPEVQRSEIRVGQQMTTTAATSIAGQSLWAFLWLAMTMGALSLLTPCVFPMIPITVSYFTNHAATKRFVAARNAAVYAVGIILTFTGLGILAALVFGAAGTNRFAASPWLNLVIALIFIAFAFSLFGAYTIAIPSRILTRLDTFSRRKEETENGATLTGLLLMALIFTLTSFTCTAPFVGTLMVMAAQGRWAYPIIGLLAFSTVFAIPFFVLALAPQLVTQLPRPGNWLNAVKIVMGLLEVAAAMKFLSNVDLVWHWGIVSREIVLAVWVAVAALISFYLLGLFRLVHDGKNEAIGSVRLLVSMVFLSLTFWLLTGLFGSRLGEIESFLPPAIANSSSTESSRSGDIGGELQWITNNYDGALNQARDQHKLLVIDFTGYTCTNCRWMEANMFTRSSVKKALEKYVRVRLYTDGEGDSYRRQQEMQQSKYGTVALPYYAIVDGNGDAIASFPGLTRNEEQFLGFLNSAYEKVTLSQ